MDKRGFVYFLPGAHAVSEPLLRERGLAHLYPCGEGMHARAQEGGPGGARGMLVASNRLPARAVRHDPNKTEWYQASERLGDYWVGFRGDAPPRPEDLARDEIIPGHEVELGDNNKWTVPLARRIDGGTELPAAFAETPGGEQRLVVVRRYHWLWRKACDFWDEWNAANAAAVEDGDGTFRIQVADYFPLSVELLAVNYRIGVMEASALQIITQQNAHEVPCALIDWPAVQADEKKTSHSAPGE